MAFKKELRAKLEPMAGTSQKQSAEFPAVTGLTTMAQRLKSLEASLTDLMSAIGSSVDSESGLVAQEPWRARHRLGGSTTDSRGTPNVRNLEKREPDGSEARRLAGTLDR